MKKTTLDRIKMSPYTKFYSIQPPTLCKLGGTRNEYIDKNPLIYSLIYEEAVCVLRVDNTRLSPREKHFPNFLEGDKATFYP